MKPIKPIAWRRRAAPKPNRPAGVTLNDLLRFGLLRREVIERSIVLRSDPDLSNAEHSAHLESLLKLIPLPGAEPSFLRGGD